MVAVVGVTVMAVTAIPVEPVPVDALPAPPQAVKAMLSPLAAKIDPIQWMLLILALQKPLGSVAARLLGCGEDPNVTSI
jgi:hypothetical protein